MASFKAPLKSPLKNLVIALPALKILSLITSTTAPSPAITCSSWSAPSFVEVNALNKAVAAKAIAAIAAPSGLAIKAVKVFNNPFAPFIALPNAGLNFPTLAEVSSNDAFACLTSPVTFLVDFAKLSTLWTAPFVSTSIFMVLTSAISYIFKISFYLLNRLPERRM